jgi:hypothetical protein
MLYAPLLAPLLAGPIQDPWGAVLLCVAATGAFCLQHVAASLIRRRLKRGELLWLAVYGLLLVVGGGPLLLRPYAVDLLLIALLGASAFGLRAAVMISQPRRNFDRSLWGEFVAVAALTLTAPAGYVLAHGGLDATAWGLWLLFVLCFASGVFFVNMLLAAVRYRETVDKATKWQLGRGHLLYHLALTAFVVALAARMESRAAVWFVLAFVPLLLRAVVGWVRLSGKLPSLKQVGMRELFYSVWFTGFLAGWLRL